jgi:hypothetical protein
LSARIEHGRSEHFAVFTIWKVTFPTSSTPPGERQLVTIGLVRLSIYLYLGFSSMNKKVLLLDLKYSLKQTTLATRHDLQNRRSVSPGRMSQFYLGVKLLRSITREAAGADCG